MPNWCENYLGVAGKLPLVKQFMDEARHGGRSISFQKLCPASESEEPVKTASLGEFRRIEGESDRDAATRFLLSDGEHPAWYLDRMQKWGVKGDASESGEPTLMTAQNCEVDDDAGDDDEVVAVYSFSTAWVAPDRLFDNVSLGHPDLAFRLKWVTEGPEEKGVVEWVGGVKTLDERSEWEALDCLDWLDRD